MSPSSYKLPRPPCYYRFRKAKCIRLWGVQQMYEHSYEVSLKWASWFKHWNRSHDSSVRFPEYDLVNCLFRYEMLEALYLFSEGISFVSQQRCLLTCSWLSSAFASIYQDGMLRWAKNSSFPVIKHWDLTTWKKHNPCSHPFATTGAASEINVYGALC